jgi:hypothetical protein
MKENPVETHRFALTLSFLLLCFVLPSASTGQENAPSESQISMATATPFAGCYELQLGRWWPWGMGEDTPLVTPPPRIELRPEKASEGLAKNGLMMRAIPPVASHRGSYWLPQGGDRIDFVWTSRFAGATVKLTRHGKELRGWAHAFFDVPFRPPHIARVTALPITCESAH